MRDNSLKSKYLYYNLFFMKAQFKNFSYMLAWVIIATALLNPTFASQIQSNLVKWFVAITSDSEKAENNLVWLDADWMFPTDVIPASAATTWEKLYFCWTYITNEIIAATKETSVSASCPTWYSIVTLKGPAHRHEMIFSTNSWHDKTWFNSSWDTTYDSVTKCCVQD